MDVICLYRAWFKPQLIMLQSWKLVSFTADHFWIQNKPVLWAFYIPWLALKTSFHIEWFDGRYILKYIQE